MLGSTAEKPTRLTETHSVTREAGSVLTKSIWLPKQLYIALPYFYVAAGLLAFITTLYISDWFWVLPHYLLFSVACLHFGIRVYRRRKRGRATDA